MHNSSRMKMRQEELWMNIQQLVELENNMSFQQLHRQINSFNTFKVLKLENYEIRHSNMLAWLLDPYENHGLQDYVIQKVLASVLLHEDNAQHADKNKLIQLLQHSFIESHVYREVKTTAGRFIDIVIVNQQQKFAIVIENKYYSTESANQLDDYLQFIESELAGFTIVPIYLTLDGEKPSNAAYFALSYEQIARILQSMLTLFHEQLPLPQYTLIEQYHAVLQDRYELNDEQIEQAIAIYQQFDQTIHALFEEMANGYKLLQFEPSYAYQFKTKYKETIAYIYNHGQNIMSYSFEQFMKRVPTPFTRVKNQPSIQSFLPAEWTAIEQYPLKASKYWLGVGLVVWFQKTADQRLLMKAELGPLESEERIALLTKFENNGLAIKERSKAESSIYTSLYTKKMDIQQWNKREEVAEAMTALYNDSQFVSVREKVAYALQNKVYVTSVDEAHLDEGNRSTNAIHAAFEKWMQQQHIPATHYRMSKNNLSFKIPLFDDYKELLGETRENWWWDNGPLLFWMDTRNNTIQFVLEVGPIIPTQRILFLEAIRDEGIPVKERGLREESKYTRLYSKTIPIEQKNEAKLLAMFNEWYEGDDVRSLLMKLDHIYQQIKLGMQ